MGLYEGIKDLARLVQKLDNVDINRKLVDLSAEALDMQAKIQELTVENAELKAYNKLCDEVVYHPDPYVTKKMDEKDIRYCAACWADKKELVPLQRDGQVGRYMECPLCRVHITKFFDD